MHLLGLNLDVNSSSSFPRCHSSLEISSQEYVVISPPYSLLFANLSIVLQHLLLFFLAIPCLIPGFATLHGVALLWLRPSRQIRSPIFSVKQKSYRRKIIAKYGLLFAVIAAIFVALIAAPLILHDRISLALDGVNL